MNNLQENEEKSVMGLYIPAVAHPLTQRVQELNWPRCLQCWGAQSWAVLHWTKLEIAQEKDHKVMCKI